jgi:hypothetical protein
VTAQLHAGTAPFLEMFAGKFRRSGSSTLNVDVIAEPVRHLVGMWERYSAVPVREPRHHYVSFAGPVEHLSIADFDIVLAVDDASPVRQLRPFPETPVEAVEYLAGLLAISRDAVLRGTQVSESSFYRWKRVPDVEPRLDSLGRLWPTVRALSQLEAVHPNLASWYHSTPEAQEAFEAGRLNRLIHLEFQWLRANARAEGSRVLSTALDEAPWFGDPADGSEGVSVEVAEGDGSQAAPLKSQSSRLAARSRDRR